MGTRFRPSDVRGLLALALASVALVSLSTTRARSATALLEEISLPAMSAPSTITLGPGGAVWFTNEGTNRIGRLTASGVLNEFPVPTLNAAVGGIATGPDGNLWFAETNALKIGRLSPSTGLITEFSTAVAINGLVAGSDGNLWAFGSAANRILVVSTAGRVLRTLTVPTASSFPHGPSLGRDGNVYFAEFNGNKIGRVTPTGSFREWLVPSSATKPFRTTIGPDGRVYFTENAGNRIGRLDPTTGIFAQFALPTPNAGPAGITSGPDGNIWFTETRASKIGRATTAGAITEVATPTAAATPKHITSGSDGRLWFTEATANKIGILTPPGSSPPPAPPGEISPPTISGAAIVGQTLTASPGSWTGSPSFAFVWQRCSAVGDGCAPVTNATSKMYVVSTSDIGSTLAVQVTATNAAGSATAISEPTQIVSAAAGFAPPSTPVLDTFNRPDGPAGVNWSVMNPASFAPLKIVANAAADSSTTSFAWSFWNAATFGPNTEAYVTIASYGATDTIRLGGRIAGAGTTSSSGYYVAVAPNGIWSIIRIDGGPSTVLATGPTQPLASGDRIAIQIVGSKIAALHGTPSGWAAIMSYDSSNDPIRYTAAGKVAVEFKSSTIDNFGGGTLP